MGTWLAWGAAPVSLVTCVGHVFVGGPQVARPLLDAGDLPEQAKWLAYFCWHVTTLVVLGMSAGFAVVAFTSDHTDLAVFLTSLSALIWLLSVGVTVRGGLPLGRNPGVWLFGLITLLAAAVLQVGR